LRIPDFLRIPDSLKTGPLRIASLRILMTIRCPFSEKKKFSALFSMFYGIFLHKDKIRIHRKIRYFRGSLSEKIPGGRFWFQELRT